MRTCSGWRAVVLLVLFSGVGGAEALADGAETGREAARTRAEEVLTALEDGRTEEVARLAAEPLPDPFAVAQVLFTQSLDPEDPSRAERGARALAAWALAADDHPRGRGLAALAARWRALGAEDLARERGLVHHHALVRRAQREGRYDEVVRLAEEAEAEVEAAPWSLTAWGIAAEAAAAEKARGRNREAERALARAASRAEGLGWSLWAAVEWQRAADVAFELRRYDACATHAQRAAQHFLEVGEVREGARLRTNAGLALMQAGRAPEAEAVLLRAIADVGDRDLPDVLWGAYDILSGAQAARGDLAGARESLTRAVVMAAAAKNEAEEDRLLFRLGDTLLQNAFWAEALEVFERLERRARTSRDPALTILVHRSLAALERALGRLDRALVHAESAYRSARRAGDAEVLDDARSSLALTLSLLGRSEETAALFEGVSEADGSRAEGEALVVASERERTSGRLEDAERAARHAIAAWEGIDARSAADDARLTLARILIGRGRLEEAQAVLAQIQRSGTPERSYAGFLAAAAGAEVRLTSGRPAEAASDARTALRILRTLATGLSESDAWGTREEAVRVAETGLLAAAQWAASDAAASPLAGRAAFDLAEGSRGLLLAEGILNARALLADSLPPDLAKAEEETRRAVEEARRRALRVSSAAIGAEAELAAAWRARDAALARIERAARRATAFLAPPSPDLDALKAALGPADAHLAFAAGPSHLHAVLVRRDAVHLRDLGATEPLRRRVEGWLRVAAAPDVDDSAAAAAAYASLLGPFDAALRDVARLTVVPDGFLAFVPFEALVRDSAGAQERLVERTEVVYAGSAGVVAALRAEHADAAAGSAVFAVGDPAPGAEGAAWARLPGGAEEALDLVRRFPEADRTLLTGTEAGVSSVLQALQGDGRDWRVVHFACHAVVDPSRRRATGLVLAGGEVLDADVLARTQVRASLAVFSACESGRGRVGAGEGVFGLVRAMHLAGVPRVLVSQWVVSDLSTRRFMDRFYEAHLKRGLPPAAALRDAKIASLRAGGGEASTARWAPFVLWGLGR